MVLYDKDGNKVTLVEKFKTITLKEWSAAYPCRGDNSLYTIHVPGIFMDGTPKIEGDVKFALMGINQSTNAVSTATGVTDLYSISQTTTGLLISLNVGTNNQVNAGVAIAQSDIVITSA